MTTSKKFLDKKINGQKQLAYKDALKLIEVARLEGNIEAAKENKATEDFWRIGFYERAIQRFIKATCI